MTADLSTLSTSALEAELRRRLAAADLLRDIDSALSALGQNDLIIRLEAGRGMAEDRLSYGPTSHDMRGLLATAMRDALAARKIRIEAGS